MAYIGNTAASRFVSNRAASVFSGDGSAVAFTLEQVVTQDEDVLVSVDGVIQEPSVGYAVSSGTTLTFTAAPSTNSGNNIFVYYLASQTGTVGHPSTQGLAATSGTFSTTLASTGNATVGGTLGVTGATTLGNTGSTVKSEGGAVTTNIAQGLCKYWITYTQASDTVGDSFNHSSVTDVATGDDTLNITSDFSSAEHAANAQHMQEDGNAEMGFAVTEARAAGTIRIRGLQNNRGALHDGVFQAHSWGDLA